MDEPERLGGLPPGTAFAIIDKFFTITGTVRSQHTGYTAVKVDGSEEHINVNGREFVAHNNKNTEWSVETQVYRLDEGESMDSVPVDSAALSGAGEPIPRPRPVPTPSFSTNPKEKIVSKNTKKSPSPEVKEKLAAAKERAKTKAKAVKAEVGPSKSPKIANKCKCGCGDETFNTFRPGHDARFYGWAKKIVSGKITPAEIPNASARALLSTKALAAKVLEAHGH